MNKKLLKQLQQRLPSPIQHWLRKQWNIYKHKPPLGMTRWGDLRQLKPISLCWGLDRGQPIDRYYIENFLSAHSQDISGRVLAIGDHFYTRMYGGNHVTQSDVLHIEEGNPEATIIGDLTDAPHIPSNTFDCFILVETLQLIYEVRLAIQTAYRILNPGGVLLVTVPGITPIYDREWYQLWCWSFTAVSAKQLFQEVFPAENIQVESFGNVLAATAFLQGLAVQEVRKNELDYYDPGYPVTITVRAVKPQVKL